MLARILVVPLMALGAFAVVPSANALAEPHVPCYPDFSGGTVCVIGEDTDCFLLVSYNPDRHHPQWPAHVSPVYCRDGDARPQMTPCLPGYQPTPDVYCWSEYPEDPGPHPWEAEPRDWDVWDCIPWDDGYDEPCNLP